MKDAIEWFEAPGVFTGCLASHLQGTFMIFAQEYTGRPAIMVRILQHRTVYNFLAGAEMINICPAIQPSAWILMTGRHIGTDQPGMRQDVICFELIQPDTMQAAGCAAKGKSAALDGSGFQHTGGNIDRHTEGL